MDGKIIAIDKPQGWSSFDVVNKIRYLLNVKKVGHGGTLDPMATGVLPILIGRATKAQDIIQSSKKEYLAELKLGIKTDTQDITGSIESKSDVNCNIEQIRSAVLSFFGTIEQVPPMYSAIKIKGQRLYNLARKGKEVKRELRIVNIYGIKLLNYDENNKIAVIWVSCSKGTYIRTLCSDIGDTLECGATLTALRRTYTCGISIDDCITIEDLEKSLNDGNFSKGVINLDEISKYTDKIYKKSYIGGSFS